MVYKQQEIGSVISQIEEIERNAATLPEWLLPETNKKYNKLKEKLEWEKELNRALETAA